MEDSRPRLSLLRTSHLFFHFAQRHAANRAVGSQKPMVLLVLAIQPSRSSSTCWALPSRISTVMSAKPTNSVTRQDHSAPSFRQVPVHIFAFGASGRNFGDCYRAFSTRI